MLIAYSSLQDPVVESNSCPRFLPHWCLSNHNKRRKDPVTALSFPHLWSFSASFSVEIKLSRKTIVALLQLFGMSTGDLLDIRPTELKFPFELNKQSSCSLQLTNKTDQYVAFKVKTTNPKRYCVRPNTDIVLPGATCNVKVTMQAQKEAPPDMQCKDKFLLQSVIASPGATVKNITPEMFNKEAGKLVNEFKLRVVYIPANLPSPVPEGSEEGPSPQASLVDNGHAVASLFNSASSLVYKLTEEKKSAIEQNQRLHQELELMRREVSKRRSGGFSFMFIVLIGLLGILVGYLIEKT